MTEEEPGKILHEVRFDVSSGLSLGGKSNYYGSVDATPLFLMVLGAVSRWGFAADTIKALLRHADRALDWITNDGDMALGDDLTNRAARLKKQFNEQFWIPERGYYAIALDGRKRQVDEPQLGAECRPWHGAAIPETSQLHVDLPVVQRLPFSRSCHNESLCRNTKAVFV